MGDANDAPYCTGKPIKFMSFDLLYDSNGTTLPYIGIPSIDGTNHKITWYLDVATQKALAVHQ